MKSGTKKEVLASGNAWNFGDEGILIRVALLKNSDVAFPAGHIDPLADGIIPKVVGVAHPVHAGHDCARLGVEDNQFGGIPAADEKAMVRCIERHRIEGFESGQRPFVNHHTLPAFATAT